MMNLFFKGPKIRPSWPPKFVWSGPSVSLGRTPISVLPCLYHRDENKKLWFLVPCSGTLRIWWCYTNIHAGTFVFLFKNCRSEFCSLSITYSWIVLSWKRVPRERRKSRFQLVWFCDISDEAKLVHSNCHLVWTLVDRFVNKYYTLRWSAQIRCSVEGRKDRNEHV